MFCGKETSTLSFMFLVFNAKLLNQRTGSSLRLRLFRNHEAKKLARGTTNEYEFSTFSSTIHLHVSSEGDFCFVGYLVVSGLPPRR